MIPTVLAGQLKQGIEDFLETTFPISTPYFEGMIRRFIEKKENLFKGPYLSLSLPFKKSEGQREYFPGLPLPFDPYLHQVKSFERLSGSPARSTVVATGTGSGKTECFLYPILNHCLKHAGNGGIKAILIYPMNALASDQAERLARIIYNSPALRGKVRAGLFVGQTETQPQAIMGEHRIISDKAILRATPPDILLTNYKMLDYLLIRPRDRGLWMNNRPESLKYLVVDELHTFDGAQGTDLACLLRRLKSRLDVPANHLCCVGTSATIGSEQEQTGLQGYAREVFDEPFEEGSIIHEEHISVGEFLEECYIKYVHTIGQGDREKLQPSHYPDKATYLEGQYRLWFNGEEPDTSDPEEWPLELGKNLKQHQLFQNLLRIVHGRVLSLPELAEELRRVTGLGGEVPAAFYMDLVSSLCALISTARTEGPSGGSLPFLQLRVQVWLRELRRMTAEVKPGPDLHFSDDLKQQPEHRHFPVIHCRDCGGTGWGAVQKRNDTQLQGELSGFYNEYFSQGPQLRFLFPLTGEEVEGASDYHSRIGAVLQYLCPKCLRLRFVDKPCCPQSKLPPIPVLVPNILVQGPDQNNSSHDCPFCLSRRGLNIVGSRSAGLSSVLIGQLSASPYNDDKKLVAFSDSVQDTAHRGGFFAARTYTATFRSALAQVIEGTKQEEPITLEQLPALFSSYWRGRWPDTAYVANFIAHNMEWLAEYDQMRQSGELPPGSELLKLVEQRVEWNIYSEFAYRARIGRTLERNGIAAVYPDMEAVDRVVADNREKIKNEIFGLDEVHTGRLKQFVLGMLMHLKLQGGIFYPFMENYVESFGNGFLLNRLPFQPPVAPSSRLPCFLTDQSRGRFELLAGDAVQLRTWHDNWIYKHYSDVSMISRNSKSFYLILLSGLEKEGLLEKRQFNRGSVWGLSRQRLYVSSGVDQYRCRACGHRVSAAPEEPWQDAFCLRLACDGKYEAYDQGETYYGGLYRGADIHRLVVREHTGLLSRDERSRVEKDFKEGVNPWDPNLLSATPTIEMGIDIGELSSILLCSIPPGPANYLQRIGRAGRKNGNALSAAVANAQPHDLYFFAEPEDMIAGKIVPPGVFLEAPAILARQFTAFCFDRWVRSGISPSELPDTLGQVLNNIDAEKETHFPYTFIAFIQANADKLFDDFTGLFEGVLGEESRGSLLEFLQDQDPDTDGLYRKIMKNLQELADERKAYRNQLDVLRRLIKRKEEDPARDKNYEEEVGKLGNERSALQEMIKGINRKDALNFFTDEGLIPNYTFPEAGVVLKSVIYRRRLKDEAEAPAKAGAKPSSKKKKEYRQWIYEYDRPARGAISELVPANTFFAGGRRVMVDRVDLKISKPEDWRFCPDCTYCQNTRTAKRERERCPRCDSAMWNDVGQVHSMLRLRQVYAETYDKDSRIGDEKDQRDPEYFHRQMLVDAFPGYIRKAYRITEGAYPFGFEFLEKVKFREINFGKQTEQGITTRIANQAKVRPGFAICKHCGKIDKIRRGEPTALGKKGKQAKEKEESRHHISCTAPNKNDPANFEQCIYLYREFTSEAIRLLLPIDNIGEGDKKFQSFVAALHLGLKQKFGGAVDHLFTTIQAVPIPGSGPKEFLSFLLLYDQVPGGTGYLKQLMQSENELMEVLEMSLGVLKACGCAQDPDKDGCYRCLLAFRSSRHLKDTSRALAMGIIEQILNHMKKSGLELVDRLDMKSPPALFESELEARFIDALFHLSVQPDGKPAVTISKELINGKPGYTLKVGEHHYVIEKQPPLGPHQGVAINCRPDFLIRPQRPTTSSPSLHPSSPPSPSSPSSPPSPSSPSSPPSPSSPSSPSLAIFLDGFRWHGNIAGGDTAKRMAIRESGEYLIWSITWKDIHDCFQPRGEYFDHFAHRGPQGGKGRYRSMLKLLEAEKLEGVVGMNSFRMLLCYLSEPDEPLWCSFAFADALSRLDNRRFTNHPDHQRQVAGFTARRKQLLSTSMLAFEQFQSGSEGRIYGWEPHPREEDTPELEFQVTAKYKSNQPGDCMVNLYLPDTPAFKEHDRYQRAWTSFFRLYNIMQFLPLCFITTHSGLEDGAYDPIIPNRSHEALPDAKVPGVPEFEPQWEELSHLVAPEILPLLPELCSAGFPIPEAGYELTGAGGAIVAEAEMGWPEHKTALLLPIPGEEENPGGPCFHKAGWETVELGHTEETVQLLRRSIGINTKTKKG